MAFCIIPHVIIPHLFPQTGLYLAHIYVPSGIFTHEEWMVNKYELIKVLGCFAVVRCRLDVMIEL